MGHSLQDFSTVETFFRRASEEGAPIEDRWFVNLQSGTFGVADGVSEAYSPSHPRRAYPGNLSGGAMATLNFALSGMTRQNVRNLLQQANLMTRLAHRTLGLDPVSGDDVGGCVFSACQILKDEGRAHFILAGDCFALYKKGNKYHFLTGFDEAAERREEGDKEVFNFLKEKNGGVVTAETWDAYHPHFKARKVRCSNKLIGSGGYPILNGDPELLKCWYESSVDLSRIDWVVLGTDGLIPAAALAADVRADTLGECFNKHGFQGLVALRDELDYQPHIQKGLHPEGTGVIIWF